MPTWTEILTEINGGSNNPPASVDDVRKKYLKLLGIHNNRNIIAYYSGWLIPKPDDFNSSINDLDKHALMSVIAGLDKTKGLDLILHTPGGSIDATESIVDYLWTVFNKDIRVIVPQLAMSAGTMIACSARQIIMGKHSNLGPFDPQMFSPGIGFNVPAQGVLDEYKVAIDQIQNNPASTPLWQTIYSRVHPSFINECMLAMKHSESLVKKWLIENMLIGKDTKNNLADTIVDKLSDHDKTKSHGRHISREECVALGLEIVELEQDQIMQDLVLSVHHAFMITFSQTQARKIVENNNGLTNASLMPVLQSPHQFIVPQNLIPTLQSEEDVSKSEKRNSINVLGRARRFIKSFY
jgi:hypothetical protein